MGTVSSQPPGTLTAQHRLDYLFFLRRIVRDAAGQDGTTTGAANAGGAGGAGVDSAAV